MPWRGAGIRLCAPFTLCQIASLSVCSGASDPVPRHELVGALVDKYGAKRSKADAYLRRIRADVPSQEYVREYVRRIKADNARQAGETGPPTAGALKQRTPVWTAACRP
jgi:hypothetical protein